MLIIFEQFREFVLTLLTEVQVSPKAIDLDHQTEHFLDRRGLP
jgi:hypothetical protein